MTTDALNKAVVAGVNIEQVRSIMEITPSYTNKFFFSVEDNIVRITFAEENSASGIIAYRNSVVMSIGGFMALVKMLVPQADRIKTEFEAQLKASVEAHAQNNAQ